ncbi:hypothetical protein HDU84_000779 [Entophlyctis sp. JEL0112]|nr:hypothetical protein HDU84_000779 [Entophlyctis sp. JEL0112]
MAIEIIEQFKTDNKDHVAVMYELSYADGDIPIPADSFRDDELGFVVGGESQLKCMLEALLKIESLSHHRDLINELLIQLQLYKEGKERANGFLRITEIRMKLRNLCTTADECSRLMLALELGKAF